MEADHASKKLMDAENQRLRNRLFEKSRKPTKRRDGGSRARHMTGEESKIALAQDIWKVQLAEVHKELLAGAKAREAVRQALAKVFESVAKKIKERQRIAQREDKELRKAEDAAERQRNREEARRRKEDEARHKKEQKERDARAKREAVEAEKARKAAENAQKKAEKQATQRIRKRKATEIEVESQLTNSDSENQIPTPKRPCPCRPRPRPVVQLCLVPLTTGGPADISPAEKCDGEAIGGPLPRSFALDVLNRDHTSQHDVARGIIDPLLMDQS
jgi:hypothetical protein